MLAPTPASPESAGMSSTALARVDRHLKSRYIDAGRYPGAQLLVYRRGKIVHSSVQGYADLERKAPVKEDTIFRIYSMTKPITSIAFMMLVEEGRVAIDEPVHKYIPEWKNLGVFVAGSHPAFLTKPPVAADADHRPAAPHLGPDLRLPAALQCRCRLPHIEDRRGGRRRTRWTTMIADLAKLPLEFSPGEAWNYSRVGRRARLSHRKDLGPAVRAVPEGAHLQAARHERHRLPCAGRQGAPLCRLLFGRSARRDQIPRRRAQGHAHPAGRSARPARTSSRRHSSPAAADCARRHPTISPSAARCSTAASSAASG